MRGMVYRVCLCATGITAGLAASSERAYGQYSLTQLKELFQAGVRAEAVVEATRSKCLAFQLGAAEERELVASGATSQAVSQLRGVCVAGGVVTTDTAVASPGAWVPDPSWTDKPQVLGPDTSAAALERQALMAALAQGAEAMQRKDYASAFAAWDRVIAIDPRQISLLVNRAKTEVENGQLGAAMASFRRLYTAGGETGRPADEQREWRSRGLDGMVWTAAQYVERGDHVGGQAALRQVLEVDPGNFTARANLVAGLYTAKQWTALLPVLDQSHEMEPLNHGHLIMRYFANTALAESSEGAAATGYGEAAEQARLAAEALPVQISSLNLRNENGTSTLSGTLSGGSLAEGSSVTLQVTFTTPQGPVGEQMVTLTAPAPGTSVPFSASATTGVAASGIRYRIP